MTNPIRDQEPIYSTTHCYMTTPKERKLRALHGQVMKIQSFKKIKFLRDITEPIHSPMFLPMHDKVEVSKNNEVPALSILDKRNNIVEKNHAIRKIIRSINTNTFLRTISNYLRISYFDKPRLTKLITLKNLHIFQQQIIRSIESMAKENAKRTLYTPNSCPIIGLVTSWNLDSWILYINYDFLSQVQF